MLGQKKRKYDHFYHKLINFKITTLELLNILNFGDRLTKLLNFTTVAAPIKPGIDNSQRPCGSISFVNNGVAGHIK